MKYSKSLDAEKNPIIFSVIKLILQNNLHDLAPYQSWRAYFVRYIDPEVIHRKKDIKEFEKKFGADFFEILFSMHLIIYLIGKQLLKYKKIQESQQLKLKEYLFEDIFSKLSSDTIHNINEKIELVFRNTISLNYSSVYDLVEQIYRDISPREIRKPLGEYFTPLSLAKRMISEIDNKNYSNELWMDDSSGFGVFLLAYLLQFGQEKINQFICIEMNPLSVFISKVIILCEFGDSLLDLNTVNIFWGDALLNEKYEYQKGKIVKNGDFTNYYNQIGVLIGNPPWVSWKSMTKEYQEMIGDDWRSYDIFEKNITRKTMGACNDDISSYFVYFSIDKFLKSEGLLKFVINLSLFKSNLVGKQFRQFNIKKTNIPFKITQIQDLTDFKIFQGITNTYCIFDAIKGKPTTYPIKYLIYSGRDNSEDISITTARPVNDEMGGALITVNGRNKHFDSIEGLCEYKARAGVCTWLNSAYWVKILSTEQNYEKITNLGMSGKKKLKEIEALVERDLVFRLLRARNLRNFTPIIENHIVVPQQADDLSRPISENVMIQKYKNTLTFFLNFKDELLERSGYQKFLTDQPFYTLYNIGPYTKAPIKIGWQFISKKFQVFIINNAEDIIPDLNVMFIPIDNQKEAYYLHALLNSVYATEKIESSSNWTFPSGVIKKIYLEKYNSKDDLHLSISALQKKILSDKENDHASEMDQLFKEYWFNGRRKKEKVNQAQLSLV